MLKGRSRKTSGRHDSSVDVALLVPLHGPSGLFGPSCEACAQLAVEELNAAGGVLGRPLRLLVVDAGGPPPRVAQEVAALVLYGVVDAVVGWHLSTIRQAVSPLTARHIPYIYTALYEGGERTPGVFLTGEVPSRQLAPAMQWMASQRGSRRWCIVGNDYVWPRVSAARARRYARASGGEVVEQLFVPLGTDDFSSVMTRVERSQADAVLMLLVGDDAVHFNRLFAARELDSACMRLSPLMDENMLLATGATGTRGLCAAAGFFETLITADSIDFRCNYAKRFGPHAPTLSSEGESCYEGIKLLAALATRARSLEPAAMRVVADEVVYAGARGELQMRHQHVDQPIYLAEADALEFDVLTRL